MPLTLYSDNGPQFVSKKFKEVLAKFQINHHRTLSYNPQGNSIIERSHAEIIDGLRCTDERNIDMALLKINDAHNSTHHTTLGCSPLQLAFGKSKFGPDKLEDVQELLKTAHSIKELNSKKNLEKKNTSRIPTTFLGKKVLVKNLDKTKLSPPFLGPFDVIEDCPDFNTVTVVINGNHVKYTYREIKPFKEEKSVVTNQN